MKSATKPHKTTAPPPETERDGQRLDAQLQRLQLDGRRTPE
jgi:hypothetical protein